VSLICESVSCPAFVPNLFLAFSLTVINNAANLNGVCQCAVTYFACVKINCGADTQLIIQTQCSALKSTCPNLEGCADVPTIPLGLPPNLPPFTLPPGTDFPPSLSLPPSFTLPPGVTFPPSISVPTVLTPTKATPTSGLPVAVPVAVPVLRTCTSAKDCQSCIGFNSMLAM
jgi:hypothetical protein